MRHQRIREMNKKMREKLDQILDQEVVIENKTLSHDDIQRIEKKNHLKLPPDYKEFISGSYEMYLNDQYGFPLMETSKFTPENGFETMDYFYVGSLEDNIKSFFENYRDDMIPIGEAGGDFICMGVKGNQLGKIFYLYHEEEIEDRICLAANSFQEFILSFQQIEEECPVDLAKIKIELDEDLWND